MYKTLTKSLILIESIRISLDLKVIVLNLFHLNLFLLADCFTVSLNVMIFCFCKQTSQTAVMFTEESPVVQLSYSSVALLASTQKRSVISKYTEEEPTQIGQKERKMYSN